MVSLLRHGRIKGIQAIKTLNLLPAVTHRQYATPSTARKQATAAATVNNNLKSAAVKPLSECPGPMRVPVFGTSFSMLMDKDFDRKKMNVYFRKLKATYGDVVRLDLPGFGPMVLVFHPDDCETVARITMHNPIRKGSNSWKKVRDDAVDNYFEKKPGLLASNGEEWWRVRSRVQIPMMKPKNVTAYLTQMDDVALNFTDKIADFQKKFGEMPSDFQSELYKWALESVCLVALNRRLGCLNTNLEENSEPMILIREANSIMENMNITEFGPQFWRFFPTPAYIKLKNSHNEFLRVADENIRETEAQLMAKDPNSEEELTLMETLLLTPGLTRKDVVTLILDMLFAGIDTTSHTVAFTLYLLARNPKVQLKLQEEVDRVLGDHQGPLTPKVLGQLTYMKACLKESLRIFPLAVGTARTLEKEAVVGGYLIPEGYSVAPFSMFSAEDERFFPKAAEFIPERWQRDRPMGPIHGYASQPFGLGTRMCVGRRIAEQELYTLLTRIMQRFSVDYKYDDMKILTRLVSVPSEPLRFNFYERRK